MAIVINSLDHYEYKAFDDLLSGGSDDRIMIASGNKDIYVTPRLQSFKISVVPDAVGTAGTIDVYESVDGVHFFSTGSSFSMTVAEPPIVSVSGPVKALRFVPNSVSGVISYELYILGV